MMTSNYQMVIILFQIFKIKLSLSLKNIKHWQELIVFMFTSIELMID